MGQISEDMTDGSCCIECGQYFQHPKHPNAILTHGYPVLCKECYDENIKLGARVEFDRATADTLGNEPDDLDDNNDHGNH